MGKKSAADIIETGVTDNQDKGNQLWKDTGAGKGESKEQFNESLDTAGNLYWDDANDGGGYRPGTAEKIADEEGIEEALTTDDEFDEEFLTPEEEEGMRPKTETYDDYFDPQALLDVEDKHESDRTDIDTSMGTQYSDAIGNDLYASEGYFNDMDEAVDSTQERIDEYGDPTRLRADEGALDEIRMDDEEQARMVSGAAKTVGNKMRAAGQQVSRAGRAAGLSAAGQGAQSMRYERSTNADAADAALQARIGSGAARASRAGYAENIRMTGEDAAGNLATKQAFGLGKLRADVAQSAEDTRMGGVQDVSDRRIGMTEFQHGARTDTAKDVREGKSDTIKFNTETGTEIVRNIALDDAEANTTIAKHRTETQTGTREAKHKEKSWATEETSDRAITTGDQEEKDEDEGKEFFAGLPELHSNRELKQGDQMIDTFGVQTGNTSDLAGQKTAQERTPTKLDKAAGFVIDLAGATNPKP